MTTSYAVRRVQSHYPRFSADYIKWRLGYSTYVNPDRGYLYYQVPKAACTLMKHLIHSLENLPPIPPFAGHQREVRRDMFIHERYEFGLKSLIDFDDDTQEHILTSPDFFRFTIVRDPYTRLVSAWKDKVRTCAPGYEYLYHRIKGALPNGDITASFIAFEEFIEAVSQEDLASCNPHWRAQSEQVFRDAIDFGLVGKTESLNDAIATFVRRAGFSAARVPVAANASWGGGVHYDQGLADKVYALYQRDFTGFGYSRDSWRSGQAAGPSSPATISEARFLDEITERNIVIGHLYQERETLRRRVLELEQSLNAAKDREQPERTDSGTVMITTCYGEPFWRAVGPWAAQLRAVTDCPIEIVSLDGRRHDEKIGTGIETVMADTGGAEPAYGTGGRYRLERILSHLEAGRTCVQIDLDVRMKRDFSPLWRLPYDFIVSRALVFPEFAREKLGFVACTGFYVAKPTAIRFCRALIEHLARNTFGSGLDQYVVNAMLGNAGPPSEEVVHLDGISFGVTVFDVDGCQIAVLSKEAVERGDDTDISIFGNHSRSIVEEYREEGLPGRGTRTEAAPKPDTA